jgi:hypothetical protein
MLDIGVDANHNGLAIDFAIRDRLIPMTGSAGNGGSYSELSDGKIGCIRVCR